MQRIEKNLSYTLKELKNSLSALPFSSDSVCFFDIETTGLSARVSSVYLIGAACFDSHTDELHLTQWFADDYTSEPELLQSFSVYLQSFLAVVHYNGTTFDIPYLEKKYQQHKIPSPFTNITSLDLFTEIRRQKNWFSCKNRKLSTMEKLLGFQRSDTYTGKDCINLYTEFMQKKIFRDTDASAECKEKLLLHNHDDLIGTILCSQFLYYTRYCSHHPACEICALSDEFAHSILLCDTINGYFPIPWEKQISFPIREKKKDKNDSIKIESLSPSGTIAFQENQIKIRISLIQGTLCHFFKDYKNYYYLPIEDMAVHKSVGTYVDPSRREKATAANCYTKKTGTFLPLPDQKALQSLPHFQEERKSPVHYIYLEENQPISEEQKEELFRMYFTIAKF